MGKAEKDVDISKCDLEDNVPSFSNDAAVALSCLLIQHAVQNQVWECPPKPPILCAAGLSHATTTSMTRTNRPI